MTTVPGMDGTEALSGRTLVFYDGNCSLCRREITHYRRIDRSGELCWVDITDDHGLLDEHRLSFEAAMRELHVLDKSGVWHRGIDGFTVIWRHLPRYRWLSRLIQLPGIHPAARVAYRRFAEWRFTRRCTTGQCIPLHGTQCSDHSDRCS